MQLSPGARVRSFEVLGPIGVGGMGAVYRAKDLKLGRQVAIKLLQENLTQDREYLARFAREARAASALNHPNIVTIFEINEIDGSPFIAMELVEGVSLRDLLKKGPIPLRKLLDIAAQIADGLSAAHERNIVHRDLKPENVMLTEDGRVKIVDFGLARINQPADAQVSTADLTSIHTPEGRVLGTAAYVSPEQARGGGKVDSRSDQFSFGSILYELITGRRAFDCDSAAETLAAIIHEEPEPLQQLKPKTPPPLCWIVERCMAKDPADRYASTRDLARELRTLRDRLPETSPGALRVPLRRRKRLMMIGSAAVLVVLAAIAGIWVRSHSRTADLPNQKYVAVLPFKDLSGRPDGQLFSQGFSEAVSSRLAKYSGIQVIPPASSQPLVSKGANFRRIAQELGATLLLNASVQRAGESLRVSYSVVDPNRGSEVTGGVVNGSVKDLWSAQDDVAEAVMRDLGGEQPRLAMRDTGLQTAEEQDLYVRALGALDRSNDEKSVDTALTLLREITEANSNSSLVQSALARAYLAKYTITFDKQWSDHAIKASERAKMIDPNSAEVLLTLGRVQELTGNSDDAISTFKRVLALQPNSAEAALALGEAYGQKRENVRAEQAFHRGIALRPTWWYGYNQLGVLYLHQQRLDDAAAQFQRVINLNPDNAWAYQNLGVVLVSKSDLPGAVSLFEKASALGATGAHSNLSYCYYFLGNYDRAAAEARKAIEAAPSVPTRWLNLADACTLSSTCRNEATADYSKAADLSKRDLAVNPRNARAHGTLAVCLAKLGRLNEAHQHLKLVLDLEPQNPVHMYQAARVAVAEHEDEQATMWLRRALKAGYPAFEIKHDPEFKALRADNFGT